jgi:hypothetical protein
MTSIRIAAASALAAASLAATDAAAQSILLPSTPEKGFALEATHPNFREAEVTAASTVLYLSGRYPVAPNVRLIADLPFAHGEPEGALGEVVEGKATVIGNPKVGLEFAVLPALTLEGSVRLPLTTADEASTGDVVAMLSDPQRLEAFAMDVVPVTAAATYERSVAGGLGLRARAGATQVFLTGDAADEDDVTLLDYGLFGTYGAGAARLGLGVSGRYHANGDEDDPTRSLHFAGATADFQVAGVRPGVSVQLPLDSDYRDVIGPQVGVYLQVPLR